MNASANTSLNISPEYSKKWAARSPPHLKFNHLSIYKEFETSHDERYANYACLIVSVFVENTRLVLVTEDECEAGKGDAELDAVLNPVGCWFPELSVEQEKD